MPLYNYPPIVTDVTVDFGFATGQEETNTSVTVSAPWVRTGSQITCSPLGVATVDHDAEDVIVEGLVAYATNIIQGVSFVVEVYAPSNTWGKYVIRTVAQQ